MLARILPKEYSHPTDIRKRRQCSISIEAFINVMGNDEYMAKSFVLVGWVWIVDGEIKDRDKQNASRFDPMGIVYAPSLLPRSGGSSLKQKSEKTRYSVREIGNGVPISAVITTLEIAKVLKYTYYFSTFGGNHACTVAGLAVLNVLRQINFSKMHKLCPVGSYLKKRLNSPMEKHEISSPSLAFRQMAGNFEFIKDITYRKYLWKIAVKVKDKWIVQKEGKEYLEMKRALETCCDL
ncbi:glycine transaminase [Trifolium repens]|nr:glycine transaminase [Trifolium repens]